MATLDWVAPEKKHKGRPIRLGELNQSPEPSFRPFPSSPLPSGRHRRLRPNLAADMNRKKTRKPLKTSKEAPQQESSDCFEGDRLVDLLAKLGRSIEAAKLSKKDQLPDKIWLKQQFAIGANDVTRVLERMRPGEKEEHSAEERSDDSLRRAPLVPLQAVILASDCIPRSLIKHIPSLASSRKVPVILVKDKKGGSLRLGELVKLKTATAIGVKARGSSINTTIDELL